MEGDSPDPRISEKMPKYQGGMEDHSIEKLESDDERKDEGSGRRRGMTRKSLLMDVNAGKIKDPSRILQIQKGISILQPDDSFDSDDSDKYFDPDNELVISTLQEAIIEEKKEK